MTHDAAMLTTPRLTLRAPQAADAQAITDLVSDPDVAGMTSNIPHPYAVADALWWIALEKPDRYVILRDGLLIGGCSAMPTDDNALELGYWVGKPYWGQGYMTEAAGALIAHLRQRNPRQRITVGHFLGNDRSRRVIEKLGFRFTGNRDDVAPARGRTVTVARYELPLDRELVP